MHLVDDVYENCKAHLAAPENPPVNHVKAFYEPFTPEEISDKIGKLLSPEGITAEVQILYQTIENLHQACPKNLGDWYFTGDYPTAGGMRVVNRSFVNFYEGRNERAY